MQRRPQHEKPEGKIPPQPLIMTAGAGQTRAHALHLSCAIDKTADRIRLLSSLDTHSGL